MGILSFFYALCVPEDTKARSLATCKCRGGNAANALVICSQLGGRCRWLNTSSNPKKDSDAAIIHADLKAFNVDCSLALIKKEGNMPVSYILASRATGSRTIVHSRSIAELSAEEFAVRIKHYFTKIRQDVTAPVWFHFEGRNMETVRNMMLYVRDHASQAIISVEIEFPRYSWMLAKTLASLADYVFISKDYLRENINVSTADEFFKRIVAQHWDEKWNQWVKAFVCPWGAEGVYYLDMKTSKMHHISAARLDKVVESNGAGDSFIGATLAGLSRQNVRLNDALKTACDVATVKCTQHGFKLPTDHLLKWQQSLQLSKITDDVKAPVSTSYAACIGSRIVSKSGTSKHLVTSEVELELKQAAMIDTNVHNVYIVPLLPFVKEDKDGDLIVPRRQVNKRHKAAKPLTCPDRILSPISNDSPQHNTCSTDITFVLEASSCTTWDTSGTQLWRAAFLLADFIYSAPVRLICCNDTPVTSYKTFYRVYVEQKTFENQYILELGCGIGFAAIVASQLGRCVYATDSDTDALFLTRQNIRRNLCGDIRLRYLNWDNSDIIPIVDDTSVLHFKWISTDQAELKLLTVIIASDIFYDNTSALLFLRTLRRLMLQYNRAIAYVASERRSVFSAVAMQVVSLGYDTFQRYICRHDPRTCHTYVSNNQVQCRLCTTESVSEEENKDLGFIVEKISTTIIPQRFKYDRTSTLMIWRINAIVV